MLTGPSGAGKSTIISELRAREPGLWFSVSHTTRAPRPGERDGVDYHFVSREEFEAMRDRGGFLEWFEVYGELKGTPAAPVAEHLAAGDDVVLEIDVQGARRVRELHPEAVLVFLRPPSREEQRRRVRGRPVEVPEDLEGRLAAAEAEEAEAEHFDAVIVNDDLDASVREVAGILDRWRNAPPS